MWVGWEAMVLMVPAVSVTLLCDGICPAAIITDFSIQSKAPESELHNYLRDPVGDVNEITESLSVLWRLAPRRRM